MFEGDQTRDSKFLYLHLVLEKSSCTKCLCLLVFG